MAILNRKRSHTNNKSSRILKGRKEKINKYLPIIPWNKTSKSDLKIIDLPPSVLLHIFSFVSLDDLFLNIRLVCKQWYNLAASSSLWKTIAVGPDIPTQLLLNWLEKATRLKSLRVENRLDAGQILNKVFKHNKNIKNIRVHDCWGCEKRINLPSAPLCKILLRCPYLDSISLRGSRFISCKFFRLLATRDMLMEKRKRCIDQKRRARKLQYYGPALKKQFQVFLKSRLEHNKNKLDLLTVESMPTDGTSNSVTVRQELTVRCEEDIDEILDSLNFV